MTLVSLVSRLPGGNVIRLGSPRCTGDVAGVKASRLSELVRAGYQVPRGEVITQLGLLAFCEHNRVRLDGPADSVSRAILAGSFPPALLEELYRAFEQLSSQRLAVRSSSVAEDGVQHSMAGQLKTFLNVARREALEEIKQCWAAAFNPGVVAYAAHHGIKQHWRMGVLLQEQVDARYAGVLFTLDPKRRSSEQMVLEWVEGLGDALVSGQVTPARAYVRRKAPALSADAPARLHELLPELHRVALELERLHRAPLDIEWCIDDRGLHWLQARPITALSNRRSVVWTNVNMVENFPEPLTPFTWSMVDMFFSGYMTSALRAFGVPDSQIAAERTLLGELTGIQCGRVYYNLTTWHALLGLAPCSDYFRSCLDDYIGQSVRLSPVRAEPARDDRHLARFWLKVLRGHWLTPARLDAFEAEFQRRRRHWRAVPYTDRELPALVDLIRDVMSFVEGSYEPPVMADFFAMVLPGVLKALCARWRPDRPGLAVELLQGLKVPSTEAARLMWEIARSVGANAALRARLLDRQFTALEAELDAVSRALFDQFMSAFGSRCYNGCLLTVATFEEQRELFWELIRKFCESPRLDSWPQQSGAARTGVADEALVQLPVWQRLALNSVLSCAERAIAMRERGRLVQSLLFGELRYMLLEIGRKLEASRHLASWDDVFFLEFSEVDQLSRGKYHSYQLLPQLIELRRATLQRNLTLDPDELVILERGEQLDVAPAQRSTNADAPGRRSLLGDPVANGRCRGRARVILDPSDAHRLERGDVLVTRTTDPGWTPLFLLASGLVLERGGMLSHGAIVARELGIPAVVGVEDATRVIADGCWLSVDGHSGEVLVLASEASSLTAPV